MTGSICQALPSAPCCRTCSSSRPRRRRPRLRRCCPRRHRHSSRPRRRLRLGPNRYCSPRHRMPFNVQFEGSNCIRRGGRQHLSGPTTAVVPTSAATAAAGARVGVVALLPALEASSLRSAPLSTVPTAAATAILTAASAT